MRYGYSVCYPSDALIPQGEPENNDGKKFLSKDNRVEVLVYGAYNDLNEPSPVEDLYSNSIKSAEKEGIQITYKLLKPDRYVISGEGQGKIFYEKVVLVYDIFKTLRLEYPSEAKADFDAITSTMSGCFNTNLKPTLSRHIWRRYANVRFAYSVCYPSDVLIPQGESENSDGQRFLSKDNRVEVLVYGSYYGADDGERVEDSYSYEINSAEKEGMQITYKLLKPDRYVISGQEQGKIFYEKVVRADGIFKTLRLKYPSELKDDFDAITSTMSGCFHTNLPRAF